MVWWAEASHLIGTLWEFRKRSSYAVGSYYFWRINPGYLVSHQVKNIETVLKMKSNKFT